MIRHEVDQVGLKLSPHFRDAFRKLMFTSICSCETLIIFIQSQVYKHPNKHVCQATSTQARKQGCSLNVPALPERKSFGRWNLLGLTWVSWIAIVTIITIILLYYVPKSYSKCQRRLVSSVETKAKIRMLVASTFQLNVSSNHRPKVQNIQRQLVNSPPTLQASLRLQPGESEIYIKLVALLKSSLSAARPKQPSCDSSVPAFRNPV